jgi:hypothetical protein
MADTAPRVTPRLYVTPRIVAVPRGVVTPRFVIGTPRDNNKR